MTNFELIREREQYQRESRELEARAMGIAPRHVQLLELGPPAWLVEKLGLVGKQTIKQMVGRK